MADDPSNSDAAPLRRILLLCVAFVVPCAVIALSIFFIVKGGAGRGVPPAASSVAALPEAGPPAPVAAATASNTPLLEQGEAPVSADAGASEDDEEPSTVKHAPAPPKHFATVQQAAAGSCSTESVDGLSRQIIEQARCIKPNDFVALPKRPNLTMAPHVFPYLEVGARDHLLKALDAHTSATMTINSCLRTVAQQYLVWHWAASKSCGVQLATPPGESNHEIGTALDIAEASKWRPALETQEFRWLGTSDRVHFDYKGDSAPHTATDVLAFQKLWNRNHPEDAIVENGRYSPAMEQRLKKAPTGGFPIGASCGKGVQKH
jgi:D-alanyl-D-alanine carboxypeptidase